MAGELTVTLYKVASCDYHNEGEGETFAGVREIFDDVLEWLPGLASIGETLTYEPSEDGSLLRTFCFDARRIPGFDAILFAMWNESANVDDTIQLLAVNSAIGNADVSAVEIDASSLPGYPSYFVVIPGEAQFLNLRFEHRLNGTKAFQQYVRGFMSREARYCRWSEDGLHLLGYSPDEGGPRQGYTPRFEYQLVRRAGRTSWFRDRVSDIRKIVRRTVIYPAIDEHRTFFDEAQRLLGMRPNRRLRAGINFQYEYKTHLDLGKLNAILEQCAQPALDDDWSDVGFEFAKQSGKIHWISGSYAREKEQLQVPRTEGGMVNTAELAVLLGQGHLARLLRSARG